MFCGKCGEQMVETAKFCGKCGTSNLPSAGVISKTEEKPVSPTSQVNPVFYSEDWTQRKVFVIAAFPYFDIMADRKYLYLIKLGQFYWSTLGTIAGLLILSLIGAIVGYYLGSANDKKKRIFQRSSWIDTNHQLKSNDYESSLFLKIPIQHVKDAVVFEKHKMIIQYNGQKIVLVKKVEEVARLNKFINEYVL